jgi:diacylglycerol kinase (ATP)
LHKPPELTESPFKGKTGVARIVQAFFNSIAGFGDAWTHESAFRQEILLACVMIPGAFMMPVTPVERALLLAVVLLVLVVELLNSSVEAAIDRISFEHHSLSKRAKDIGSAAVFVSLCLTVLVWGVILLPRL